MTPARSPASSLSPSPVPGARPRSRNQHFSLPLPGSPSSSWAVYRSRLRSIFSGLLQDASADGGPKMLAAFWLFGLINNVLYVVILSAAQDLVGSDVPKAAVLLADVLPSFFVKLLAPYFIHRVPYALRVWAFAVTSSAGMCLIALAPSDDVLLRMFGVVLASLSSGGGELSFLGLTHYYGQLSLAAWGSGTGAAGIVGAGLYVLLTEWMGIGVRNSLLVSAALPVVMLISFFVILPRDTLAEGGKSRRAYEPVGHGDDAASSDSDSDDALDVPHVTPTNVTSSLLETGHQGVVTRLSGLGHNLRRARSLFVPYMLPLFLVYLAEYTINQGVAPTLLFPLESTPFDEYRDFYPMYGLLYQVGVFVSRTSVAVLRIRRLYLPSLLQVGNLALLALHAAFPFLPSVWVVFAVIFWEGLLGGAVYVNTFADIMETVPAPDREFSLAATSVSDSAGICASGFLGMALEVWLCNWQVRHGRDWCKRIGVSSHT